jgi:hypothetical protein
MNVSTIVSFTPSMETILVENNIPAPSVDAIHVQEIVQDDLYLLKTQDTVESGFRGLIISLKNNKIVCPGSRWFPKRLFANYESAMETLEGETKYQYQVTQEGTMLNVFYYEGSLYLSTNGKCLSANEIATDNAGSKWNYAYTKKNKDIFNIHKFALTNLFPSYIAGDDEYLARYMGVSDGNVLTLMVHAKQLLMCSKNTDIHEYHTKRWHQIFVEERKTPFTLLNGHTGSGTFNVMQTFNTISDAIDFQRATTSQEYTNLVGEPEDEILAIDPETRQIQFCISTKNTETRRLVCQGDDSERELIRNIYGLKSPRAFNVSFRVNQLFNIVSVKELNKVTSLDYLMNDAGMGTSLSRMLLAKILDKMDKLISDPTVKHADKLHHWFFHFIPAGYWIHGKEFAERDFLPEDDESFHTILEFYNIEPSMLYTWSVKNERMMALACALLNLFKSVNDNLWDDMVDAVVQCFYERMHVCHLCFQGKQTIMSQLADKPAQLQERALYLINGLDTLTTRMRKYRISNRVMELPSWRINELFINS